VIDVLTASETRERAPIPRMPITPSRAIRTRSVPHATYSRYVRFKHPTGSDRGGSEPPARVSAPHAHDRARATLANCAFLGILTVSLVFHDRARALCTRAHLRAGLHAKRSLPRP
jgi:hypothetical protein